MTAPEGFASVTPYFFVDDASAFMRFLVAGLGGQEIQVSFRPDGSVANAQVRLGSHTVMVSEATPAYPPMAASYYLYVEDADTAMGQALAAGASEEMPVMDMPYGDRQGGVRDPHGNLWWISQRLKPGPYGA